MSEYRSTWVHPSDSSFTIHPSIIQNAEVLSAMQYKNSNRVGKRPGGVRRHLGGGGHDDRDRDFRGSGHHAATGGHAGDGAGGVGGRRGPQPFRGAQLRGAGRGAAGGGRRIRLHAPRLRPPVRIPLRLDAIHHRQDRLDCRHRHGVCHLPRLLLPALARNGVGSFSPFGRPRHWNCA